MQSCPEGRKKKTNVFITQVLLIPCSWDNKDLGIQDKKVSVQEQITFRAIYKNKVLVKQVIIYVDLKDTLKYLTRHLSW